MTQKIVSLVQTKTLVDLFSETTNLFGVEIGQQGVLMINPCTDVDVHVD